MITLQAPLSPIPAASAARGDVNGAEPAGGAEIPPGPDFAALMAGMLSDASKPGAAATTGTSATDADTGQGEQAPPVNPGDAAAAIEGAIAIALPSAAPANAAAPAVVPAPIRGQGAAIPVELPRSGAAVPVQLPRSNAAIPVELPRSGAANPVELPRSGAANPVELPRSNAAIPVELPRSGAAPARAATGAPRARDPITELHTPQRSAAPAGEEETKSVALPPDGSTHGSTHAFDLPPQAPDAAQAACQPELQALQPASHAAQAPAAPAAHGPSIDAPLGSARWREDLAAHITVLIRNTASEAEIRVTPPELGPIHARISIDNGIASVTLSAPAPETRDALEAALATLRERLAESGLTLGEASVSDQRASRFDDRAQRFEDRAMRDAPGAESAPDALLPGKTARRLRLDGLVDLYA